MHRDLFRWLSLALALFFALPATAQYTRDAAAKKKIDESINSHYLATNFDKAEGVLLGTIKACEDKCSPQTLARAWMYVGIVRGSGRSDQDGAAAAFQSALALDPNVKLDAGLATEETQATFQSAGGAAMGGTPAPVEGAQGGTEVAEGELSCTPIVTEVETRRPIPVECETDEDATSLELRYRPFGAETWKSVSMRKHGGSFRAQIPCDATQLSGTLRFYVRAKNAGGETVANFGSKSTPVEMQLVEESSMEPPSYEDSDPPERCATKEICPPDFPGCDSGEKSRGNVDWGGSCENSTECKSGLLCVDGTCETAPSCESDADCPAGTCIGGKCDIGDDTSPKTGFKKNWLGIHVGQDIALISGTDMCTLQGQADQNFACYYAGTTDAPLVDDVYPGASIASGTVMATTRILLSYERALTANVTAGLRAGYALRGGPPAGRDVDYEGNEIDSVKAEGTPFLPFHAEVRVAYYFGSNALGKTGLRPYIHAGGGLAQVDGKVVVLAKDCGIYAQMDPNAYANCAAGTVPDDQRLADSEVEVDAWKKLGRGFVTGGGGGVLAFNRTTGLQLNINLMYMLPTSGFVIEPSLGLVFGL